MRSRVAIAVARVLVPAITIVVAALAWSKTARAQGEVVWMTPDLAPPPTGERRALVWDPEWSRASTADYVITGAGAAAALTMAIIPPQSRHFYGGILFDEDARNALRLPTVGGRYAARDTSDVMVSLETTYPFFVDALIVAWGKRRSADVAYQMAVIDAEAIAIAAAVQGVTNVFASRERPYGRTCGSSDVPANLDDCTSPNRYRSYFSGHATVSFTSAGLICSHHFHLDLQGSAVDTTTCVTAYAAAATTSILRVMGDMHYASDVISGAIIGTAIGLGIPAIHYARHIESEGPERGFNFHIVPSLGGAAFVGTF